MNELFAFPQTSNLSTLEVCSQQDAIQIQVYLYLNLQVYCL